MAKKSRELLQVQLAKQILQMARDSRLEQGQRFTERALAEQFGVSRSPIRDALRLLADKGFVNVKTASGYELALGHTELAQRQLDLPDTIAESLYVRILRDRFAGAIPRQFTEAESKRRYQVSPGLLRSVLLRMFEEGLVRRGQGQGWVFTEVVNTVEAYQASYEFRLVLEPAALLSPGFRIDQERLEHLYAQQRKLFHSDAAELTGIQHFELNTEFHETLVSFSQNQFLLQAIRQHNQLRRVVEYESYYQHERIIESAREHLTILDALKSGDREWAASVLRHHLQLAKQSLRVFEVAGASSEERAAASSI